jgi:hypothetical protein
LSKNACLQTAVKLDKQIQLGQPKLQTFLSGFCFKFSCFGRKNKFNFVKNDKGNEMRKKVDINFV